ncbi:N-acetylmuramoyl-L-alanine amidase LytC [bioreactor metagenome]|uniref:N-acetylmuramoyl-L-alanine amidase LytC n=1 Tax=bioreactor metagenome TaxID=1076179 RepID=A0A645GNX5_9ZZZZ
MTFYRSGESSQLASKVQSALIKQTGATDKGTDAATFYVLRNTSMPSILVEMGFISNANEAARLSDNSYRNNVAQGIYNGIAEYFNNR